MSLFDYLAPIYDLLDKLSPRLPRSREKIIEKIDLERGDKILDVGGGTGKLLEGIREKRPDFGLYLLDESKRMMKGSSFSRNKVLGKACSLPFDPAFFDLVICVDALHHFEKKKESLREMDRVLRPGGDIIILEFDPKSPLTWFILIGERVFGEPSSFYGPERLKEFFPGYEFDTDRINTSEYILHGKKR